jgi:hypothetical protein
MRDQKPRPVKDAVCAVWLSDPRHAGKGDLLHMPVIGAAAAAEHIEVVVPLNETAVLAPEFDGIACVQIGRRIEFGVAAPRSIGADAA